MPAAAAIITALKILAAANEAAALATKAIEAANNGDDEAAQDYLAQSQARYDAARDGWDAAGD